MQKFFNTNLEIEYFDNPYDDYQNHTQADISSLVNNLNFHPKISLEEGIKLYSKEIYSTYMMKFND